MKPITQRFSSFIYLNSLLFIVAFCAFVFMPHVSQAQTGIAAIVNGDPVTTFDVQRRAAFLKLQGQTGNINRMARDQMVEQKLKQQELARRNVVIPSTEVDNAYAGFASNNNITVTQLNQMMMETGVTPQHFKTYIQVQMGWGRLLSARFRAEGMITEQQAVQRMLQNGGKKPSVKEYHLQQVIFVVPANRRNAILGKRRNEANAFRNKFRSCDTTRQLAIGTLDVTVRDLGRILEPQLPEEWKNAVVRTSAGRTTPIQNTARGVEFLAVCEVRTVSDDRVAQLVFSMEDQKNSSRESAELDAKYVKELRDRARIQYR